MHVYRIVACLLVVSIIAYQYLFVAWLMMLKPAGLYRSGLAGAVHRAMLAPGRVRSVGGTSTITGCFSGR